MRVILTSFRDIDNNAVGGPFLSVARWNPKKHRDMERVTWLAPWDPDTGEKMTTETPAEEFRYKYERLLEQNRSKIISWLDDWVVDQITLCCWCHPGRQPKNEGLFCHTILLGWWIEENTEHEIVMRDGRDNPIWERHTDF